MDILISLCVWVINKHTIANKLLKYIAYALILWKLIPRRLIVIPYYKFILDKEN